MKLEVRWTFLSWLRASSRVFSDKKKSIKVINDNLYVFCSFFVETSPHIPGACCHSKLDICESRPFHSLSFWEGKLFPFNPIISNKRLSSNLSCMSWASAYGKNFVGGAEHNLPEWNLLITDAQDDSFMTSSFLRHTLRARAFKIVQIFSVNRDQHF